MQVTWPLPRRVRLERSWNLHETYQLSRVQLITPDDGHRRCSKHVEFRDKVKFCILDASCLLFIRRYSQPICARPLYHEQRALIAYGGKGAIVALARSTTYFLAFHLCQQLSSVNRVALEMEHAATFSSPRLFSRSCAQFHIQRYVSFDQHDSRRGYNRPCTLSLTLKKLKSIKVEPLQQREMSASEIKSPLTMSLLLPMALPGVTHLPEGPICQ
jgi:hypothetical protein